ncbi:unnamed protein product, partial [Polarella glacialis]
ARANVLAAEVEREEDASLFRRVQAVPNLDLFILSPDGEEASGAPEHELRCLRTECDLKAMLEPHGSRPITACV